MFITQEMVPYVPETTVAKNGREIPQAMQEEGWEIRTFMPRWGIINERRNQLHEVIRLSGMNIIVDDTDHPLIIKVASIQAARMQVYFIDNDDYYHKRGIYTDENGVEFADNIERAIFYARGVLETVKKLRWCPDIICCQGWISAVAPFYIKTAYREDPPFAEAKVVTSLYSQMPDASTVERLAECLQFRNATVDIVKEAGIDLNAPDSLGQLAVKFSDGVIQGEPGAQPALADYAESQGIPVLRTIENGDRPAAYSDFFNSILG